jgi:hypothetical protein
METWQAIAGAVILVLGTLGGGLKWFLTWIDKRDAAFLGALEKGQERLEKVNDRRVEDAREYAKAYSAAIDPLKEALERLQTPPI